MGSARDFFKNSLTSGAGSKYDRKKLIKMLKEISANESLDMTQRFHTYDTTLNLTVECVANPSLYKSPEGDIIKHPVQISQVRRLLNALANVGRADKQSRSAEFNGRDVFYLLSDDELAGDEIVESKTVLNAAIDVLSRKKTEDSPAEEADAEAEDDEIDEDEIFED